MDDCLGQHSISFSFGFFFFWLIFEGAPTPVSPHALRERILGWMTQSRKWLVSFGSSGEVIAWEQGDEVWDGEDVNTPYPLGVLPPDLALDWELDGDGDMDPSLAILEAIEEDFC
jgi:hypothetical protein